MAATASIVVIGAGPAGAASALELARANFQVTLFGRTPVWKIGESLSPEARIHLVRLGSWGRFQQDQHLPCPGIVSVWGDSLPVAKDFIFNPNGHGWQLDRIQFETTLLELAAEAGCRIQLDVAVDHIERCGNGWSVRTAANEFHADWLLDCTGRYAWIARQEGGAFTQLDSLVSVYAIAGSSTPGDCDARTYVESHPEGWCYTALMPNGRRTVAFQTDGDLLPGPSVTASWLWQRVGACPEICHLLKENHYECEASPQVAAAHSGRFERSWGANWIAVGDAAMTFDPLTGQGSAKALESACRAVQAILHGEDYQAFCDRWWANYIVERQEYYRAEQRWKTSPFWFRRHR